MFFWFSYRSCFYLQVDLNCFFFEEAAFHRSKSAALISHPVVICWAVPQQQEDRPLNRLEHLHPIVRF